MLIHYKTRRSLFETLVPVELARGMWLTLRRMFSKPVTRQYPHEEPKVWRGFRGRHALVRNPKTGKSRCIGCMKCVSVCPSGCIKVKMGKDENNKRVLVSYELNGLRCVYCGYCAAVCPVNVVILTEVFAYPAGTREEIQWNLPRLLANWDSYSAKIGETADEYVNPLWRPRGLPDSAIPAGKRLKVDEEWRGENQAVGRKWRKEAEEAPEAGEGGANAEEVTTTAA